LSGLFTASVGQIFFPLLTTFAVTVFNFTALVMLSIFYAWPSSFALAIILSMAVASIVGYVFYKFFWATIGITGLFSGYFLGSFAYAMFFAITGYTSDMFMALSAGSCATIGCYYAYQHGDKLALGLTSVIGPY
jgi:hypothetical protein